MRTRTIFIFAMIALLIAACAPVPGPAPLPAPNATAVQPAAQAPATNPTAAQPAASAPVPSVPPAVVTPAVIPAGWQVYANPAGFAISYPANWTAQAQPDSADGNIHTEALKGPEGEVDLELGGGLRRRVSLRIHDGQGRAG